ncbi:Caltractin [Porphyridium purpureum]|uniref:Caltractin n=1 Tax=Porphyridium purpureum TaxID=35688 RepID=A0A5J4YU07_PORPP|nr:Caltractin [Porphyridium purpureum]|eukprot:POR1983..scf229_5
MVTSKLGVAFFGERRGAGNDGLGPVSMSGPASLGGAAGGAQKVAYKDKLTDEQVEEIQESFYIFEKEDKGLDQKNLKNAMKALGFDPSREELRQLMIICDPDKDGWVEIQEFTEMMAYQVSERALNQELRIAFSLFDRGEKGSIALNDLRAVVQHLGEDLDDDALVRMIQAADTDGDGEVSEQEYLAVIKKSNFF